MILNNSGIVHCATRTRGREETAMNMQELLTYVEELTFKTSMFGYDKDEVDIQLDKICDEAEAARALVNNFCFLIKFVVSLLFLYTFRN